MRRMLVLSLLVVGVAALLAAGSYSVLASAGPVASVADAVVGAVDSDDADGGDIAQDFEEGDGGEGAQDIAQVIADEFGGSQEDVLALHDGGIGFGALFKLHALATATGTTVDELLATIPTDGDGGYEFGFGKLRKALTEEQQAMYESGPKNLGQLVSASHKPDDAGADADGDATATGPEKASDKFAAQASNGHGPPAHAKAHGRN